MNQGLNLELQGAIEVVGTSSQVVSTSSCMRIRADTSEMPSFEVTTVYLEDNTPIRKTASPPFHRVEHRISHLVAVQHNTLCITMADVTPSASW